MSESTNNQSTGKSWFFMREYNPDPIAEENVDPNSTEDSATKSETQLMKSLDLQQQAINELNAKMEKLEEKVVDRLFDLDSKLEKLIQSNKSLIAYFSAVNGRDVRGLNYCIRSYSSKNNTPLPPVSFVPEHHNEI